MNHSTPAGPIAWGRDRGLSPLATHIQSLRDYEQACRLRYNNLDPRLREDDKVRGIDGLRAVR